MTQQTDRGVQDATKPRPRPARTLVRRAAILGAGTMGSQIAAHLANQGIPCDLIDLPLDKSTPPADLLAEQAKKRLTTLRPSPIYGPKTLDLIRAGSFAENLSRIAEADWVVEAVAEKLEVKRAVWSRAAEYVKPGAILSTNTSGIPIASIAEAIPERLRDRFLGTHFFNPPRYLQLLEVIPGPDTDSGLIEEVARFGEQVLGKSVVLAHDVPNFVANRIGCYGLMATLHLMTEFDLGPDEVDSVTGPAMGRPRSATLRTYDVVGIDVFNDVCATARRHGTPEEQRVFTMPPHVDRMIERGWLGQKSGQGFYKRMKVDGETQILALDPESLEYRPRRSLDAPSLSSIRRLADPGLRIETLVNADDDAGRFAWRTLAPLLSYAARQIGIAADDVESVDRAMRGGFGWELGPFETWDLLGVAYTVERMRGDGLEVPDWVAALATRGGTFYRVDSGRMLQFTSSGRYEPVPEREGALSPAFVRATRPRVEEWPHGTLFDLGDDVAFLDFHPPKQAAGPDTLEMLERAGERAASEFAGLVVGSHVRPNFCVGANLSYFIQCAETGQWDALEAFLLRFQNALVALRQLSIPVVSAPYGLTLGGGVELAIASDRIVAAAESYLGFVEVNAGLIPAGGGTTTMLFRAMNGLPGGVEAFARRSGGAPQIVPETDPNPALTRAFDLLRKARVSTCAPDAQTLGLLQPSDVVQPNIDHLLHSAKQAVLDLSALGYAPPDPRRLPVLGEDSRALLDLVVQHEVWGDTASDHDFKIAKKLSYVLTGGDRPAGGVAPESFFLELEREAFVSLCGEEKTVDRMKHVLKTGRPLRN